MFNRLLVFAHFDLDQFFGRKGFLWRNMGRKRLRCAGTKRPKLAVLPQIPTLADKFPGLSQRSRQLGGDFAFVVIGGLLFSTFLTLILIPVIYEGVESRKK